MAEALAGMPRRRARLSAAVISPAVSLAADAGPGEMDRYADRLDSAAGEADEAKTRPDDDEDEQDDE